MTTSYKATEKLQKDKNYYYELQTLLKLMKFGLGNQELGLENQELKHGEIS